MFFCDFDSKEPTPIAFGDDLPIPIMPKHAFEGKDSIYIAQIWNGLPAIGTGPFKGTDDLRDEIIAGKSVTLVRNPYYNFTDDNGSPAGLGAEYGRNARIGKLVLKFFEDEDDLILSVKTGGTDLGGIGIRNFIALQSDTSRPETVTLQSILSPRSFSRQTIFCLLETYENPLRKDPAVQRVVALATDKKRINEAIFRNQSEIGYGLFSPANERWYWEPDDEPSTFSVYDENGSAIYSYTKPLSRVMEYDIAEANRILDAAGYVWANESGMTVRKAGPTAAKRLAAMGIVGDESIVLDRKLTFSHSVMMSDLDGKDIGEFLLTEWEKIGVWVVNGSSHSITLISDVIYWPSSTWPMRFDTEQRTSSGGLDPAYLAYLPSSFALSYGLNPYGTDNDTYDSFYLKAMTALNYSERKKWTDECSKWVYLSGSIIVTAYPKSCFIMNTEKFEFGNWTEKPGLCITNGWSEPPLLTSLEYLIEYGSPTTLTGYGILLIAYTLITDSVLIAWSLRMTDGWKEKKGLDERV